MDSTSLSEKSAKSSNPSEYGFVYSAERPTPPPEVGWNENQDNDKKISLYGENVLKEVDTTESVDRESIANLSSTKKQWEEIFTSQNVDQTDTPNKRRTTPKWEVSVPYTKKHSTSLVSQESHTTGSETGSNYTEDPAMFKKKADTESAIDREIRLAFEREHIIKKQVEERQKQKQKGQGHTIITSYEAESESFQPVYNELAEADRGSDLWHVEHGRRLPNDNHNNDEDDDTNPNESIIEREIRLQREREEEVVRMRKQSTVTQPELQQPQQKQQQPPQEQQHQSSHHHTQQEVKSANQNQGKLVLYEDAISKNVHEGESMIARELREGREREEELQKLHSSLKGTHLIDMVDGTSEPSQAAQKTKLPANTPKTSQVEPPTSSGLWQRDLSPFFSQHPGESNDSTNSNSVRAPPDSMPSRRDVKVRPITEDQNEDDDAKQNYFEKQETPIEREMRLARERENDLRRQKGLPELVTEDSDAYDSYGTTHNASNIASEPRLRRVSQPSETMKKLASSRLQQEILQQKEREHELRSQGKIISTSEEHIELKNYMQVAGVDKVDGSEKRNFVTKKTSVSSYELEAMSPQAMSTTGQITRKTSTSASGGNMFSYKEFKQTAESKIEKELREMREREEELRTRRTSSHTESNQ